MDELVQSVVCYNARPILFHGYLAPFFVLQAAVYYYFSLEHQNNDHNSSQQAFSASLNDGSSSNNNNDTSTSADDALRRHSYEIWVIAVTISFAAQVMTYLFCHWSVDVKCWLSYSHCKDPFEAAYVKVTPTANNGSTELLPLRRGKISNRDILWFVFQKTKYVLDEKSGKFVTVEFPCDRKISYYKQWKGYSDPNEIQAIDKQYGRNELDMVIPEFKELFIERATAPFFVFQTFCVGLWILDEYWYYAVFTLFMLVAFEVVLVKHQLSNMQEIRRMGNQPYNVQVFRQNKWKPIASDQLIVGDLISITRSDHNIPCDILLIKGSCIVDESTLTGESVPQMKEPLEDIDSSEGDRKLDINQDKLHILFGGTKVLQHTAPNKEQGCIGYVLQTGFHTSQGKLLRTILFGVKRVTANNFETFCFIMFLLFFAIMSACYVWTKGVEDPKRSRYRLFFECTVIITSVVPPELPIELSLAVNSSLLSLSRLYIYCTEPFRIPFAGKVEYCCFDKTGTLTSDDLLVEGVAGLPNVEVETESSETRNGINTKMEANLSITTIDKCPEYTQRVLSSCHSLAHLDDNLVGDPLEKKVLEAINWNYSKSGVVTPKKGRCSPLKIHQRFHFNSTLKRMSVIASYKIDLSNENVYICTAKGAPEFMKPLMKSLPEDYNDIYLSMSRQGFRVLALGFRTLGQLSHTELSGLKREDVEKDLLFAGFLLISCPLKPDSAAVSLELLNSGHRLVMITGDGALTACHIARKLQFVTKEVLILTKSTSKKSAYEWNWNSIENEDLSVPFEGMGDEVANLTKKFDLCLTGESLGFIFKELKEKQTYDIICRVKVFARVSPKQKESIVTTLKSTGKTVLMCGDGTNDVGALKHAQVGVALLTSSATPAAPARRENITEALARIRTEGQPRTRMTEAQAQARLTETQQKIKALLEEQERAQFVKLGDASIAAPFTSRLSSTQCISHIIKQGRCTLVVTLQMFKILALNALLSAYCHSVLYLNGIKFSDEQYTLQGILSTFCFLFITRSQPLKNLSSRRPLPNIFNLYTILTVTLQFAVHFSALIFLYSQSQLVQAAFGEAKNSTLLLDANATDVLTNLIEEKNETLSTATPAQPESDLLSNLHTKFEPSIVNSAVYIIWMSVQLSTFVVNYKGYPFMQDLRSNKPLCYSFLASMFVMFVCVNGWSPTLSEHLSIVDFPNEFRPILLGVIVMDFVLTFVIDRICEYLFGRLTLKPL